MYYKLSYYTIITDYIPNTDNKIVFGTRNAKAFLLKKEYIENLKIGSLQNIPFDIIGELIDSEILVDKDENELIEVTEKSKLTISDNKGKYLHYSIMTTANCQLGCNYCGQVHIKHNATNNVLNKTYERIKLTVNKGDYDHLNISWFGGEPLMSFKEMRMLNSKIKDLTELNKIKYSTHLVSNGLSLKKNIYIELAEDFNCRFIEITLDGTKEFHDKRRDTKAKIDTFDIMMSNIIDITNMPEYPINGCKIRIRSNVDDSNKDGIIPLIDLLAEHELQDKVFFYTAPVYHWGNHAHLNTTKEEYAINEIDYLLRLYEHGFDINPIPSTRDIVCSAVTPDYELIDPYGKVYNCTEIPLVPFYGKEYVIGNLNKSIENVSKFEERPYVNWYDEIKEKDNGYWCTSCKILPLCGGRCPKSWKDGVPPCPSMKFNIEDRLYLANFMVNNVDNISNLE